MEIVCYVQFVDIECYVLELNTALNLVASARIVKLIHLIERKSNPTRRVYSHIATPLSHSAIATKYKKLVQKKYSIHSIMLKGKNAHVTTPLTI